PSAPVPPPRGAVGDWGPDGPIVAALPPRRAARVGSPADPPGLGGARLPAQRGERLLLSGAGDAAAVRPVRVADSRAALVLARLHRRVVRGPGGNARQPHDLADRGGPRRSGPGAGRPLRQRGPPHPLRPACRPPG